MGHGSLSHGLWAWRRGSEKASIDVCLDGLFDEGPNPWVLNLRARPRAKVQVGRETSAVTAREATAEEIDRYWPRLTQIWPAYGAFFEAGGKRSVFILAPTQPR